MNRALAWFLRRRRPTHGASLSFRGAFFVFGTTLIGLAAIDAGINLLLVIFGLCVSACLMSFVSGWHSLRRLSVKRAAPDSVTAGQLFEIRYTVKNTARWGTVRNLHVSEVIDSGAPMGPPETFIPRLRPGESVIVAAPSAARSRGRVKFTRIRLGTQFPFAIFEKAVIVHQEHELAVYPRLGRMVGDVHSTSRTSESLQSGGAPSRIRGEEEYYGVREYRVGDNPRRIHWRRTAQTGQLMVREMAKSRDLRFWCVLNATVSTREPSDMVRLESAISAAATLICEALEKGIKVGLICSGETPVILPPGGGRAHRPRLLRELAMRSREPRDDLAATIQRAVWPNRWRGACYLFGAHESDDLREAARALNFALGPTTVLIPGTAIFEAMFVLPEKLYPADLLKGAA